MANKWQVNVANHTQHADSNKRLSIYSKKWQPREVLNNGCRRGSGYAVHLKSSHKLKQATLLLGTLYSLAASATALFLTITVIGLIGGVACVLTPLLEFILHVIDWPHVDLQTTTCRIDAEHQHT